MLSRVARIAVLVAACVASAFAGAFLLMSAFGSSVEPFSLGTARVRAVPSLEGRVDLYVPIVDWGVRAAPFAAPISVEVRFRSLDRNEALDTLLSRTTEERLVTLRGELAEVGRAAIRRSLLLGLAGGVGGGLVGGAVVGVLLHRRRWLAYGAGIGLVVPVLYAGIVIATLRQVDYEAFEEPTFYANGSELPRLLSLSHELLDAGEGYTESYEQSLAALANLVAYASEDRIPQGSTTSAIVASDLHSNTLVLPVLREYTLGKPVFLAGDFTVRGTTPESRLVPAIADLGETVVAVSGNHDSRPFMLELVRAGVVVLTRDGRLLEDGSTDGRPVVDVDGLRVAGFEDPLEAPTARFDLRPLDLSGPSFDEAAAELVSWFDEVPLRPDIVLVHQHGLAHALLESLAGEDDARPLLILTGHDHEQHLHEEGAVVLVDGGTVGAGGPFAIGVESSGLAEIHFDDDGTALALDLIEVEPVSGNARASRTVLGGD